MSTPRTLAKSLHTVTTLSNVARHYRATHAGCTAHDAVRAALSIIGYDERTTIDPHDLIARAVAIVEVSK